MADEQGEVVRFFLEDTPTRDLLFSLFEIKIKHLSLPPPPPAPALSLEPAQEQNNNDDDRVADLSKEDADEAPGFVVEKENPVQVEEHDAAEIEPPASSNILEEDLSIDQRIVKLQDELFALKEELGKLDDNPFQVDQVKRLERRIRKKEDMLKKLLLEQERAKDESQDIQPLDVSGDLERLEKLKAKRSKLRKSLKTVSQRFQRNQYQAILNKLADIEKEIDGLEASLSVAKKQKVNPVVKTSAKDVLNLFEQLQDSRARRRFSNDPYLDLAGKRLEYKRQILLGKVLKRAETAENLVNQPPLWLHIVPNVAARTLFNEALNSSGVVLGQAFLVDAAKAINSDVPHTDGIISAPLAAVLMAKQFALVDSKQEPFVNADGTALLAESLLTRTTIGEMERSFRVTLITHAAVFDESVERGKFPIPNVLRYADFTFAPRIDLVNLSTNAWLSHKTDLLKYASMIYEATYLAAIERRSKQVVLGSVFVNGTTEQYKAMIAALVRVHAQLSRLLERDVKIVIAVPELTIDDLSSDLGADLSEANSILGKHGAQISYSTGNNEFRVIPSVAFEGDLDPMPDMTNVMLLNIRVEGDEQGELEAEQASVLSLHRYYQSEAERKYLCEAASSDHYFTLVDPSRPSEPTTTNSLIINTLYINGE